MPEPWQRAAWLLLWGWMPAGIGWQLLNVDRLDAYSMLGWFVWPAAPAIYLVAMLVIGRLPGRDGGPRGRGPTRPRR